MMMLMKMMCSTMVQTELLAFVSVLTIFLSSDLCKSFGIVTNQKKNI